jgi:hypothetical protein
MEAKDIMKKMPKKYFILLTKLKIYIHLIKLYEKNIFLHIL